MTDRSPRVLHVSCAGGGGTDAILQGYPKAMPGVEHRFLLRAGVPVPVGPDGTPCRAEVLPSGPRRTASSVRSALARHEPDVVHAHSSWAGALVRSVTRGTPVVYTPHCYATERTSQPRLVATGVHASERLLSRRTAAVVAVAPHEAELARHLGVRGDVEVAYQCFEDRPVRPPEPRRREGAALDLVSCGRIEPQKNPGAIAELAAAAPTGSAFTWIGSGDLDLEHALIEAGVAVTGWLDPAATATRIGEADALVHVARWEGFPLVVFEAIRAGRPAVVLDGPYLRGTGLPGVQADLRGVASCLEAVADPERCADLVAQQQRWYDDVRAGRPELAMTHLYRRLAGLTPQTEPSAG